MTDDIHEAFDAWIYSVDERRDANGWEPLTARDVQMLREGYMEAAFALRAEIEKLRVRCVELYEANNQRNAAHLVTIQERDALRAEVETRDARIQSLFQAVEHGDQPHRAWLEAAIGAHFRGDPMPIYVPSETERLKAEIEKLRVLLGKEGDV